MEIVDKIDKSLTEALKNKDQDRTLTLRSIISQKKQKEIEKRTQDKKNITDEDMILILNKMVKQRRESIELYKQGGRQDLVDKETKELKIIQEYLPEQLSEEEITKICEQSINNLKASSLKDMGKVMGIIKSKYKGSVDLSIAGKILKDKLK
ncbi:MAG: glutamyl-tRNA amidotransferase [Candidatus Pelagibacter sp.]|nr:glutamyl-tRNA amidotransferase [Candidatus Pelagibacter sp.]|tara:strand:+ start:1953 stop:2408 length:456 start_codon:yes stop_codon:yes gene_type:complete